MVLHPREFRLHRALRKTLQRFTRDPRCEVRFNSAFDRVIGSCASALREGQGGTWIGPQMVQAYQELHRAGFAYSVETWIDGELAGGLYGVALGRAVFGESMFTHVTDASKIALAALVAFCRVHGVPVIDCQQNTRHLASLGAREIPRSDFVAQVAHQASEPAPDWHFDSLYWCEFLSPEPPA
jgi:leucyl/phenylalanyl-tRNA--protein transferase